MQDSMQHEAQDGAQIGLSALLGAVPTPQSERPRKPSTKSPAVGVIAPWVRLVREGGLTLPGGLGDGEGHPCRTPRDVWKLCAPTMEALEVEEFWVLILDAQHRVTSAQMITRGILNASLVHAREVFRAAIALNAAAIVLVHNHPSGDPSPSADDRAITTQLVAGGKLLDIPVADHVIIGRGRYLSMVEAGLMA